MKAFGLSPYVQIMRGAKYKEHFTFVLRLSSSLAGKKRELAVKNGRSLSAEAERSGAKYRNRA
jgi:hypothetical protein